MNSSQEFYPAAYDNVVSVAATTTGCQIKFSQYGTWIDVSAPGSQILSTDAGTTYQFSQGASMASPMVAGLVGLMISHAPSATPQGLLIACYPLQTILNRKLSRSAWLWKN